MHDTQRQDQSTDTTPRYDTLKNMDMGDILDTAIEMCGRGKIGAALYYAAIAESGFKYQEIIYSQERNSTNRVLAKHNKELARLIGEKIRDGLISKEISPISFLDNLACTPNALPDIEETRKYFRLIDRFGGAHLRILEDSELIWNNICTSAAPPNCHYKKRYHLTN